MAKQNAWHGVFQIFRFARQEWVFIALAVAAMSMYALGEGAYVMLARVFLNAFDSIRNGEKVTGVSAEQLYHYGKLALLLAAPVALAAFAQNYLQGLVVWRLSMKLRNAVCRSLLPQSLSFFEGRRSGDLMSRITNDVGRCKSAFMLIYGDIPEQFLHVAMGLTVAAFANWKLLIGLLLTVPLIIVPVSYLARRIRRYGKEGLEKLADLTDQMSQMFSGIRVIKAFKMEDAEVQEFERVNRQLLGKMMKMVTARGLSAGTIELVVRGVMGAATLIGAWFIVTGRMSIDVGNMVACLAGLYYAFQGIRKLTKNYNELQEVIPAADRIFELIEHIPSLQDAPDAVTLDGIRTGIVFKGVSFGYGGETVLHDVSFDVKRGESVALIGRSGAGKSTVVALLCRFYEVSEGSVEIDGVDVRRIARDSLLDQISIVSQQTFLFNRSIADNIRYGRRDATMEQVEEAARLANIHDFIASLPNGYDTPCGEYGAKLSGGQRQRIAIARALLKNAEILILDEAMTGLDAESENAVRAALETLMKGRTTFVITHDLTTIQNTDRILVLRDGRLTAQGRHEDLIAAEGEYRSLYAMQFATLPSGTPQRPPLPMSEY